MWPFRRRPKVLQLEAPVLDAGPACPWAARACCEARCLAWTDGGCCLLAGHKATLAVQTARLNGGRHGRNA